MSNAIRSEILEKLEDAYEYNFQRNNNTEAQNIYDLSIVRYLFL